ncbi:hypothetical protein SDC9_86585 [bioreactor metagenome]|uniref:Uncharacterized protein n=1 Tax=bioreactor metagenome TaxID=1076179 RepID=A0A644ZGM4_9ZZZZ
MTDPVDVVAQELGLVAAHDRHVVEIVKRLHIRTAGFLRNRDRVGRIVQQVAGMIDLGIQRFEIQCEAARRHPLARRRQRFDQRGALRGVTQPHHRLPRGHDSAAAARAQGVIGIAVNAVEKTRLIRRTARRDFRLLGEVEHNAGEFDSAGIHPFQHGGIAALPGFDEAITAGGDFLRPRRPAICFEKEIDQGSQFQHLASSFVINSARFRRSDSVSNCETAIVPMRWMIS